MLLLLNSPKPCQSFQFQSSNSIIQTQTRRFPSSKHNLRLQNQSQFKVEKHNNKRRQIQYQQRLASISAEYDDYSSANSSSNRKGQEGDTSLGEKVRTVTVAYIDEIAKTQFNQDDDEFDSNTDTLVSDSALSSTSSQNKRERIVLDVVNDRPTYTYEIQLPIVGTTPQAIGGETNVMTTSVDLSQTVGLTLNEIQLTTDAAMDDSTSSASLLLGELALEMDTLRYVSLEEQLVTDKKLGLDCSFDEDGVDGSIQTFDERNEKDSLLSSMKGSVSGGGVIVSRIVRGGIAWKAGVRAGDRIVATSATVGDVSIIIIIINMITTQKLGRFFYFTLFDHLLMVSFSQMTIENMAEKYIRWS